MTTIPTIDLGNGVKMPVLGLGTWQAEKEKVVQVVKDAIDLGWRHFDGAYDYDNEAGVGQAIQDKIREGVVERKDIFITSKLWNIFHRQDLVVPALQTSLNLLGLEYVDLYLIHWPMAFKEGSVKEPRDQNGKIIYSEVSLSDTWKGMEECLKLGLCRAIGISNFNREQVDKILDSCSVKPVLNQIEINPYLSQRKLVDYCKEKGIAVTGYSPFASPERPECLQTSDPKVLEEPKLAIIGTKYGKSPAQIILRWMVQRGLAVVPKTVSKGRLSENLKIFDFTLSDEEMDEIYSLNCNRRALHLNWLTDHPEFPFAAEF